MRTAAAVGSSALAKTVKLAGADLRTAATARKLLLQKAEA